MNNRLTLIAAILVSTCFFLSSPTFAKTWSQKGKSLHVYQTSQGLHFQYCTQDPVLCETLGPKEFYSEKELKNQAFYETLKGGGLLLSEGGLALFASFYAYLMAGMGTMLDTALVSLLQMGLPPLKAYYVLIGVSGTTTAGLEGFLASKIHALNPLRAFNRARYLYQAKNGFYHSENSSIEEIKNILEEALYNI